MSSRLRLSIRTRLAIGYLVALSLALVLFSGILYGLYRGQLYSQLDLALRMDLEHADDRIDPLLGTRQVEIRPENWLIEIWKENGDRVFASAFQNQLPLGAWDSHCLDAGAPVSIISSGGLHVRVFCQQSSMHRGQYLLRVARLAENLEVRLSEFLRIIGLAVPLVVLLSAWMGRVLARRALDPIAELTIRARTITASNLSERLPVKNADDELGRLAQAFNETFSRLERSFRQMRRFTADASHELRTPLTAIRSLGEVALSHGSAQSDHREVLSNVLEETDRLRHLCDSLLLLSRADAGQIELKPELIDLGTVIGEVRSLLGILAEEKRQTIAIDVVPRFLAHVDPALVRQAITNLIDNAIKYSPNGTTITIRGFKSGEVEAVIEVSDQGPGIAPEHQALIFERFYRVDGSRSRLEGGAGLGLSLVRWIAEIHRGSVRVESEPGGGSRFALHLPT